MAQFLGGGLPTIYGYNGYELEIDYNSITKKYEGKCEKLGIYIECNSKEWLESCFRERVEKYL